MRLKIVLFLFALLALTAVVATQFPWFRARLERSSPTVAIHPLASRAFAQEPITVLSDEPRNEFPAGVTFAVSFTETGAPKEVRLRYELAPDGTGATAVANCTGSSTVSCNFALTSGRGISIIPGAEVTYHWEIEDAAGNKLSTPDKLYVHEDTRFTFKTIEQGTITVHYHSGGDSQARAVLLAAAETIDRVSALEKTQVTFPVKVYLYTTADEMQPAIAPGGTGRGFQVAGEVVYSDTAMVSADVATLDITRHEVAHIVTGQATKGPFGIALWLNEGISVYSQLRPLAGQDSALQTAINSDRVLSMKELSSSASGRVASTAGLFYGEAGSIVKFLVDTYGPDKFAEILKTFKDGSTPDKAFQAVYGFDQLGLENAWRKSVGLPERQASAAPTPRSTAQASAGTTPAAKPTAAPAGSNTSSGGGTSAVGVVIIAALAVLLLGAAAAALTIIKRRV
ncbi:MAG: peptidase MA family metallohydrolase [Chloroflexota bacterium]|nr:peptidase MA family metallohydrolase [Chloroflexota bacterium]